MIRAIIEKEYFVLLNRHNGHWKIINEKYSSGLAKKYIKTFKSFDCNNKIRKIITIFITNKCNLSCEYCRFKNVTHFPSNESAFKIDEIIHKIKRRMSIDDKVGIYFQGGEPLINRGEIYEFCKTAAMELHKYDVEFFIQTNGTLINDEVIKLVRDYDIGLGVSLDGSQHLHDLNRHTKNGTGTHDQIVKNMRKLRCNGIKYGVFCVISNPNEMIKTYHYFIKNLQIKSFLFAPLEFEGNEDVSYVKEYLSAFVKYQMKILEMNIDSYMKTGEKIKEQLTFRYLQRKIIPNSPIDPCGRTPTCSASKDIISFERNGEVSRCQNFRFKHQNTNEDTYGDLINKHNLCFDCNIQSHCSAPICFARFSEDFNEKYAEGDADAHLVVRNICKYNLLREKMIFRLIKNKKEEVLQYYFSL